MIVNTGYGYFTKDGKIIMKYELPAGVHPDPAGLAVVEVADKATLDAVVIDQAATDAYNASLMPTN